jgi:ankyrin repeat protein
MDLKDEKGRTPLSYTAQSSASGDSTKVLAFLLDHGNADINSKDNTGRTLLSYSAQSGHITNLKLLLEHQDLEINAKDNSGRTPLLYAVESGNVTNLELLLEHEDLEIDAKDNSGRTPLSYAIQKHHVEALKLLFQSGADVNAKDAEGMTAVAQALKWNRNDCQVLKLVLAQNGVDIHAENNDGQSPLRYASLLGDKKAVNLLLAPADIEKAPEDTYFQKLFHAARSGQLGRVRFFFGRRKWRC